MSFGKPRWLGVASHLFLLISFALCASHSAGSRGKRTPKLKDSLTYLWPLPEQFTFGEETLSVDPGLSLVVDGNASGSAIVRAAFDRYKGIIFKQSHGLSFLRKLREKIYAYDISQLKITVHSASEEVRYLY